MSDYAYGVYLIQQWASVAGTSPQTAVATFKSKYGEESIAALGNTFNTQHLNVGNARSQFQKLIDGGASKDSPTQADMNAAIIAVAGTPPSWGTIVSDALSETVDQIEEGASIAFTGLKWIAVIAGVGLAVYIGWESGFFRGLAKNRI